MRGEVAGELGLGEPLQLQLDRFRSQAAARAAPAPPSPPPPAVVVVAAPSRPARCAATRGRDGPRAAAPSMLVPRSSRAALGRCVGSCSSAPGVVRLPRHGEPLEQRRRPGRTPGRAGTRRARRPRPRALVGRGVRGDAAARGRSAGRRSTRTTNAAITAADAASLSAGEEEGQGVRGRATLRRIAHSARRVRAHQLGVDRRRPGAGPAAMLTRTGRTRRG